MEHNLAARIAPLLSESHYVPVLILGILYWALSRGHCIFLLVPG
jgi:hypothetical protein